MVQTIHIAYGDWSDDGHGKTDDRYYEINKTVKELREIYYKAIEEFDISEVCGQYEESEPTPEQFDWLEGHGFKFETDDLECFSIDTWSRMFIWFMKRADPTLEIKETKMIAISFMHYGYDEKGRHIGFFGYGLFY